jgi:hypothetical protein
MYVLDAIVELNDIQREELHGIERPIAYLAFQNAEINRDSKKRKKPFAPEDFYYYDNQASEKLPDAKYGAAALELIKREIYPRWGLFVYESLKIKAANATLPETLCLQCEDAIVLAPEFDGREIRGMLIAQRSASEQTREMVTPDGEKFRVRLPRVMDKFEATEEAEMVLLN